MGAVRDYDYDFTLVPDDDGSSDEITLPFTFLGTYTSCWVRNNGSVGFQGASSNYRPNTVDSPPDGFYIGESIFPYWTDIDTRDDPLLQAQVRWGMDATTFVAEWRNVGQWNRDYDGRATFQVVMTADSFELNYDTVMFDAQDAVVPGWPALAGWYLPSTAGIVYLRECDVANGGWDADLDYEVYSTHFVFGTLMDTGANALIAGSLGTWVKGRYMWPYNLPGIAGTRGTTARRFGRAR